MSFTSSWLVDNRVLLLQVWGEREPQEMQNISDSLIEALQNGSSPVHVVADLRYATSHPPKLQETQDALSILQEPKLGWVVLITNNRTLNFVGDVVSQLSRKNFKSFSTPEDAPRFLGRMDNSLPQPMPEISVPNYT